MNPALSEAGTGAPVSEAQTGSNATEIIAFENVGKCFGELEAVRDISLRVHEGEFITLVGPSGCGKSTLLNMIAGIFHPTSGTVTYRAQPVGDFNRHVGYMTQSDHLLPWRTVRQNIAVPMEIAGVAKRALRDRLDGLLELVGLRGFGDNYPSELSGGMRKRCALARLLAYDPETLLFDEPFAALDAQLRLKMQMELRRIASQLGKTILFVTHDLDEAVALADRCAIFTGRPGTIDEVLEIPLPRDRDLFGLRHNKAYLELTARLWDAMAPAIHSGEE
ncbi:MAG: ABC transporter ATP-binding protein [Burkholderiaceae bacterium]